MSPSEVPPIGDRVRAERVRRGVSVRGLAREIGVSASLISQIETGRSQPSVSTLYAITNALGISIEDVFAPEPRGDEVGPEMSTRHVLADDRAPAPDGRKPAAGTGNPPGQPAARLSPDWARRIGPIVHLDDRDALRLDTGVVWELLGQVQDVHVDFLRVTYQPGGSSSASGTLMRHPGSEYGYLISGELVLTLGFDEYHLHPGDAISFDSTTPHGYRNEGSEPAVGVWFVPERVH